MVRGLVLITAATIAFAPVADAGAISSEKKLILSGAHGDKPSLLSIDADFMRWLEASPFDGTTLYPSAHYDGRSIGLNPFDPTVRWKAEALQDSVDLYKRRMAAAGLKRKLENFLYVYCTTGSKGIESPDWFDEQFDVVINNWQVLAWICQATGLRGMFIDDERYYGPPLWSYEGSKYAPKKTAQEYYDQAFLRGVQIMSAVNERFPDIVILFLHGSGFLPPGDDPGRKNALKFAFMEGMLSKCTGKAEIVEGWERAYGYRAEPSYAVARKYVKEELLQISRVPVQARRHRRMGYALWADWGADVMQWDNNDALNNYYTPEEMAWAVHCALKHTDRYVWVWNHSLLWFANPQDLAARLGHASEAYVDALRKARQDLHGPPPARDNDNLRHRIPYRIAHKEKGYDDVSTFEKLWQDYRLLSRLNHVWKFRIDPQGLGVSEKWYQPGLDLSQWGYLRSGMYWNEQGLGFYDGYGWYRQSFTLPTVPAGKKVFLAFGAIRHRADVYVNGQLAGQFDDRSDSEPFLVDVTDHVYKERVNDLAVRLLDLDGRGSGLWKNVLLIAEKFEPNQQWIEARRKQMLRAHVPRYWKFKIDPEDLGEAGKWYATDLEDHDWDRIAIDRIWAKQKGYEYYYNAENPAIQGRAWYRVWIDVPPDFTGRKVYLGCRGLDHVSEVYVNGQLVGGNQSWNNPFELDVTTAVTPGESNLIAVRIIEGVGIYGKFEIRADP